MYTFFRSKIFKNTAWIIGGNASIAVVSFIASIIAAKQLGPIEFGELQIASAYFVILMNAENFINPNLAKKKLIENPEFEQDSIKSLGTAISSLGLIITMIGAVIYAVTKDSTCLIVTIMIAGMIFRFSNGISFYFDAHLQSKKTVVAQNVGNVISSTFKIILAFLRPYAIYQAITIPIQHFINLIIHLFIYKKDSSRELGFNINFRILKPLMILSLPLFLSSFIDLFSNRLGVFLLDHYLGKYEVGVYSAAVKLSEPWLFIGAAICSSFWPKIIQMKALDDKNYDRYIQLVFGILFYISMGIGISVYFFSDFIINNFLGAKYVSCIPILKVHIFTVLFLNWTTLTMLWEINAGMMRFTLLKNTASLFLSFAMNSILIPKFGIIGASYSALITYSFMSTFGCVLNPNSWPLIKDQLISPYSLFRMLLKRNFNLDGSNS